MRTRIIRRVCVVLFPGLSILPTAIAQDGDNQSYAPPSSEPENFFVLNDSLYFTADDGEHGRELWRYNQQEGKPQLLLDISEGTSGTSMMNFEVIEDKCYFAVDRGTDGRALWVTDGTEDGTREIKRFDFGAGKGLVRAFGRVRGGILLCVEENEGFVPWVTDGSSVSTKRIQLEDGLIAEFERPYGCLMSDFMLLPGRIPEKNTSPALWRTDGTPEGTFEVHEFVESPGEMISLGTAVVFNAMTENTGWELWKSDGTPEGTVLLLDLTHDPQSSSPSEFLALNDQQLFFVGWREDVGRELWRYHFLTGDVEVFDINVGQSGSDPYKTSMGNMIYVIGNDGRHGTELWRIGNEVEACERLSDTNPGNANGNPYALCAVGDKMFFSAHNNEIGEELWVTTGTRESTVLVKDIADGAASSSPYETIEYGGYAYFAATHPLTGRELWRTDGTPQGTILVADVNDDLSINPPSRPEQLTPCGDYLFFVANDLRHGVELWRSDGTDAGTVLVADIFPGRAGSHPHALTAAGSTLYFVADNGSHGNELWRTDGTALGTALVMDIAYPNTSSSPQELTPFKNELVFVAKNDSIGEELWITEPGAARVVVDIRPGPESARPRELVVWKGHVYFRADDGIHGEELWRTDGTAAGTKMVKDLVSLPFRGASVRNIRPRPEGLYFAADDATRGQELWRLNAANGKLELVSDIVTVENLLEAEK